MKHLAKMPGESRAPAEFPQRGPGAHQVVSKAVNVLTWHLGASAPRLELLGMLCSSPSSVSLEHWEQECSREMEPKRPKWCFWLCLPRSFLFLAL